MRWRKHCCSWISYLQQQVKFLQSFRQHLVHVIIVAGSILGVEFFEVLTSLERLTNCGEARGVITDVFLESAKRFRYHSKEGGKQWSEAEQGWWSASSPECAGNWHLENSGRSPLGRVSETTGASEASTGLIWRPFSKSHILRKLGIRRRQPRRHVFSGKNQNVESSESWEKPIQSTEKCTLSEWDKQSDDFNQKWYLEKLEDGSDEASSPTWTKILSQPDPGRSWSNRVRRVTWASQSKFRMIWGPFLRCHCLGRG